MLSSERPTWQNPKVLTTLVLVFLTGGVSGALLMHTHDASDRRTAQIAYQRAGGLTFDQLKTKLNLSPKQADQLRMVLDDFVRYNNDIDTQREDARATGKNRILAILDPQQRVRFEKICDQILTH